MPSDRSRPTSTADTLLRLLLATSDNRTTSAVLERGSLVFSYIYSGDVAAWRTRRRSAGNPVRRLATRPDCPWSALTLDRWVALHVACARSPSLATAHPRLTVGHLLAVLPLDPDEQRAFLAHADSNRLTVHALRRRVAARRRARGERRGRPSQARRPSAAGPEAP